MSAPLVITRLLAAPPERVWEAWTTHDGLTGWWWVQLPGTVIEIDPRVGGAYRMTNETVGIGVRGTFLELDPPHRLVATWIWLEAGMDGPEEQYSVDLAPHPDGTLLTLEHTGAWVDEHQADLYRQGWDSVLPHLATWLS